MFHIFCALLLSISLFGQIREVAHFHELAEYSDPNTIVLLDIDETLIVPVQMLGSDAWFEYRLKDHQKQWEFPIALEKTLAEWEAIRHLTKMKLAEAEIDSVLRALQAKKIPIMGVTIQGLALATRTVLQLKEQGIVLAATSPCSQDTCFPVDDHTVLYRQGILFTSGKPKGKSFFQFCDRIGIQPKRLVAIDDKITHLQSIEKEAEKRGVEFIGLRYSYADARLEAFSPEIVEYQLEHSTLTHILSDEEAKAGLR
ncbi:MAG: DUF2608 domain-containing protein [Parachlamydiales bacterium]|nr:DUF2608 domain-containing protein [Parachlamydiales bacterium]